MDVRTMKGAKGLERERFFADGGDAKTWSMRRGGKHGTPKGRRGYDRTRAKQRLRRDGY